MQIFDVPSSPELVNAAQRKLPRRGRSGKPTTKPIPVDEVIELTDDESDHGPRRRVQTRAKAPARVHKPVAGPSRAVAIEPQPLFNPSLDEGPNTGPLHIVHLEPPHVQPQVAEVATPEPQVPVPAPGPAPQTEEELIDVYVVQILEIVPDVVPEHARSLVQKHYPSFKDQVVQTVLHALFEDPTYPKVDRKGKRKLEDVEGSERNTRVKIDYADKNREHNGGLSYRTQALDQLSMVDFPFVPVPHVRNRFAAHNNLYAPTFLALHEQQKDPNLPYKRKQVPTRPNGKGKSVTRIPDAELEKEIEWVKNKLEGDAPGVQSVPEAAVPDNSEEPEDGIECGCCFSSYPFDKMIQCPEAHLFCTDCMTSYASTLLGSHDANIVCMDQSGCKLAFPESELRRFLPEKLLGLYERVRQRKEIEAAGLEGLEECPFCEYKCVIENEAEKLFRCENVECLAVTCRSCKKPDHLPKSCKEIEEDRKLDGRHAVEEAMTRALMRNCPKCTKAFIKEAGCNKMTCPNCQTLSCYVCRQIIKGYDHFNNKPPPYTGKQDLKKCPLWDTVEKRHHDEVAEAAQRAMDEYRAAHPDADHADLRVDLPPAPPPPQNPLPYPQMPIPMPMLMHAIHRPPVIPAPPALRQRRRRGNARQPALVAPLAPPFPPVPPIPPIQRMGVPAALPLPGLQGLMGILDYARQGLPPRGDLLGWGGGAGAGAGADPWRGLGVMGADAGAGPRPGDIMRYHEQRVREMEAAAQADIRRAEEARLRILQALHVPPPPRPGDLLVHARAPPRPVRAARAQRR